MDTDWLTSLDSYTAYGILSILVDYIDLEPIQVYDDPVLISIVSRTKNFTSNNGYLLNLAAQNGNLRTVQVLTKLGCAANEAFHLACIFGHIDVVMWLYETQNCSVQKNTLELVAEYGKAEVFKFIICTIGIKFRSDPLMNIVCASGHIDLLKILLEAGYKPNWTGRTLVVACEKGRIDIAKLLIREGVNPTVAKYAPFKAACRHNRRDIVEFLITKSAAVLDTHVLFDAAALPDTSMLELLLNTMVVHRIKIPDYNEYDALRKNLLHMGKYHVAQFLVNYEKHILH